MLERLVAEWKGDMATGDVMRMAIKGKIQGEDWEITFGLVEGSGGITADPLADACNNVIAALGATPLAGFSDQVSIVSVQATDIQPGTKSAVEVPLAVPKTGDGTEDTLPSICALVAQWHTAGRGPANRGRMYLCGLPEGTATGGYWTADALTPASAFVSKLFDPYGPLDGTDYQLNVLSYVPGSSPRALRAAIPITSFTLGNTVKSQRRRGVGVRIHRRRAAP